MFYLASRCEQQVRLHQSQLFSKLYVSDYLFEKDRLFAEHTLTGDELELYFQFSGLLAQRIAVPDFVLFLDAPTDVVMSRIKRRAINAEQIIKEDYLDELRSRYYSLWSQYTKAPVYILDTTLINYIDNPEHRQYVLDLIDGWLRDEPLDSAPAAYAGQSKTQIPLFSII